MQRYLLVIFIYQVLTVALCDSSTEDNHINSTDLNSEYVALRPKLPIFPRNKSKYVVTLKPYVNTYYPKEKMMTRMPLMPRVTPASPVTLATPQMVSRIPIMKLRTFTIPSYANGKYNKIEKLTQDFTHVSYKADAQRIIATSKTPNSVTEAHDDPITDDLPEDSVINWKNHQINKIEENAYDIQQDEQATVNKQNEEKNHQINKIEENGYDIQQDEQATVNKQNEESFALEKDDRKEFIFLENINDKQTVNDITDSIDQVLDYETSTERNSMEKEVRVKRSKNIIEEENFPTTISGFRYTRHDTMLNNNLYFKNINT